ncbi:MAG TPA: glycerol-3-phosphate 1-O-acyltransferase PlsY [Candidatus Pacearchaeota archaeon]|nr:glycerol-3-phosphate 1-O-acyltransferase PlsY [Candidatus Pacearchaeota archaeon]HOK94329.1 glycerol-3-phosphate 1-O-acyltransferase PlsY [Candidatus Pacearchaeota archaeon]HPO75315.1 glycerol-3-phosphate 1-O-acyltransferase PlsY [Candidatus Pacearchaeota archaeon]
MTTLITFILLFIFAYLLGSTPTGYLVGKAVKGIDIRKIGSGSTSATNTSRALGWGWGTFVAAFDFLKGVVPALLALNYLTNQWQIITVALLPVIGHIFPVWLKFKGGRGAGTFYGATVALLGFQFFLPPFLIWVITLAVSRLMSLANLLLPWNLSILALVLFLHGIIPLNYVVFCLVGTILITIALRDNLKRLMKGTESRI